LTPPPTLTRKWTLPGHPKSMHFLRRGGRPCPTNAPTRPTNAPAHDRAKAKLAQTARQNGDPKTRPRDGHPRTKYSAGTHCMRVCCVRRCDTTSFSRPHYRVPCPSSVLVALPSARAPRLLSPDHPCARALQRAGEAQAAQCTAQNHLLPWLKFLIWRAQATRSSNDLPPAPPTGPKRQHLPAALGRRICAHSEPNRPLTAQATSRPPRKFACQRRNTGRVPAPKVGPGSGPKSRSGPRPEDRVQGGPRVHHWGPVAMATTTGRATLEPSGPSSGAGKRTRFWGRFPAPEPGPPSGPGKRAELTKNMLPASPRVGPTRTLPTTTANHSADRRSRSRSADTREP